MLGGIFTLSIFDGNRNGKFSPSFSIHASSVQTVFIFIFWLCNKR